MIDEKFLQYFPGRFQLNTEHQMSVSEICDNLCYLADIVEKIDNKAILKYTLASGI
jgi:hypothetical protein